MEYDQDEWAHPAMQRPREAGMPWYLVAAICFFVLVVPAQVITSILAGGRDPNVPPPVWLVLASFMAFQGLAIVTIVAVVWIREGRKRILHVLQLDAFSPEDAVRICFLILIILPVMIGILAILAMAFNYFGLPMPPDTMLKLFESGSPALQWTIRIGAVVAAPISEELIFRHVLHRSCRHYVGLFHATWICSLLFGLMHLRLIAVVALFFFALILQVVHNHYRNLWYPICIHAAYNGLMVYLVSIHLPDGP